MTYLALWPCSLSHPKGSNFLELWGYGIVYLFLDKLHDVPLESFLTYYSI